jgi:predicted permease
MKLFRKIRALFRREKLEADMAEEMRAHLEMQTRENLARGMTADEASYAARRQFGGVDQIKELAREQRGVRWLEELARDIRFAFRQLRKTPGFTATALATLALCLGANLTIFAVVDAILVRALPYPDPDRLVTLYYTYPRLPSANNGASLTSYYERRGQIPALSALAAISEATSVIGEPGATSIESLGRVSPEFFSTLGVQPFIGRAFTEAEMTYQTDHVAMLSYEYWRNEYGADRGVLGKSIRVDGIARVIVGVLPPDFRFLSFRGLVYMPLSSEEGERNVGARHNIGIIQVGRLAPGATLADARAQIDAHDAAHAAEFPQAKLVADAGCHTVVAPLHADHVAAVRPMLMLLQAGALCLLLIGGVNLVNLLLIRASSRSRELAIRQALGARRGHIVREVMTETVVLAIVGSLLGLMVGALGVKLLASLGAGQLPLGARVTFNVRLAVAAMLGAVAGGLLLGAPIVWFSLRNRLAAALQSESRGSTVGRTMQRLRRGFIVGQIALAFVLLGGAGLLGFSLQHAMAVSPGFRPDHVITGRFTLTWFGYHTADSFVDFFNRLDEKTRSIPGVAAVGVVSTVPLVGGSDNNGPVTVPGRKPASDQAVMIHNRFGVAGDYFAAMGIPLREGRYLNQADAGRKELVCVVDENFARRYWPEGGALGKLIYLGSEIRDDSKPYTVVGVVGAVKQAGLTEALPPGSLYFPFSQIFIRNYFLVARTSLPPEAVGLTLARLVREIDSEVPLTDLRTMETRISTSLATRRSPALMAGIFAASALLLATVGLYGVMAYTVAQRTSEFSIRMALGALPAHVLGMVLREAGVLVGSGLLIGLIAAAGAARLIASMLYDLSPADPGTYFLVALILSVVAAIACLLPARRAARVDPMVALRCE